MSAACDERCRHNRAGWPIGQWDSEPENRVAFEHVGLPCVLHRGPLGYWCGYVGVMPGHALYEIGYSVCSINCTEYREKAYCSSEHKHTPESLLRVHGGITYSDKCNGPICHIPQSGESEHAWWFGFDFAHSHDVSPGLLGLARLLPHEGSHYYTRDEAGEETRHLAEQLAVLTGESQ